MKRWQWVDYAKGIGIFLVVLGHTIRGLINSQILAESNLVDFSDRWIYAFHIPLFFFLSGLFLERSTQKPLKEFFLSKLSTIAYSYFLWSTIQILIQVVFSSQVNSAIKLTDIWRIIYEPVMQFWFLYTLFLIVIIYGMMRKLGCLPTSFLIFSIFLYYLPLFNLNLPNWSVFYLTCNYSIYVAVGVLFGNNKNLINKLNNLKFTSLIFIFIIGILLMTIAILRDFPIKILTANLGIVASLSLALFLEKNSLAPFLKNWGKFSLEIYLVHTIASAFIRIFLKNICAITEPKIHLILGTIMGIYLPILLAKIAQNRGWKYLFTFPKN